MSLEKSNSLIDAYKSHVGRQMERQARTEECYEALRSTKKDFGDQIGIMESRAKTLQSLIDFLKRRADEMREKLTSFEVNEGDSNYDIKQENDQLKAMLSHWVQRAKALEKQVEEKAEEASDLSKILDQNSNIQQQEMDAAECLSII
jgi:chromosome segregation ATPase